jgi:peptidyl-prolyl cis-trans isomerase C
VQTRALVITSLSCALALGFSAGVVRAHPQPSAAGVAPAHAKPSNDPRRAEVIAKFDGGQVTVGDLEDTILDQNPFMQQRYLSTDAVKSLLERSLRFELLADEAERRGYAKGEEAQQATKQSAVQALIKHDIDDVITTQSIPAADVKAYYDSHRSEFVRGEGRRASEILLADEAAAKALLPKAKAADAAAFRELARANSIDATNQHRGGDLPYFTAQGGAFAQGDRDVDPALAKAVFALRNVGDTSDVVRLGTGFAILKLTGIRPAEDVSLAQADDRVRSRLWRERRQAAIESKVQALKQEQKAVVHPELIDEVQLDQGPALPPNTGLPSGFPHTRPPAFSAPRHTAPDTH